MTVAAARAQAEPMTLIALVEEIDFLTDRVESGVRLSDAEWLRLIAFWEAMKLSLDIGENSSDATACND